MTTEDIILLNVSIVIIVFTFLVVVYLCYDLNKRCNMKLANKIK